MPGLLKTFQNFPALQALGEELRISDALYTNIPCIDFSREILAAETQRLIVQRLGPVTWNDLGDCDRALAAVSCEVAEPAWVRNWRVGKPPAAASGPAALAALG